MTTNTNRRRNRRFLTTWALLLGLALLLSFCSHPLPAAHAGQPCQSWHVVYRDLHGVKHRENTKDPYYAIAFTRDASFVGYRIIRVWSHDATGCDDE